MNPDTAVRGVPAWMERMASVDLDELFDIADLQTRRDRKYLLPVDEAWALLDGTAARVLEIDGLRSFDYESIYFDTASRDSYLGSARRRPRRFKVRTRTYLDTQECLLEVKVRDHRGNTVKHRRPYDLGQRHHLTAAGAAFVTEVEAAAPFVALLGAALEVRYHRSTFVLSSTSDRVTVDRCISWAGIGSPSLQVRGLAIIETKSSGPPTEVDRKLWQAGHRPRSISKYCTGLAAVDPSLPSNKWHRVLERHVLPNLGFDGSRR